MARRQLDVRILGRPACATLYPRVFNGPQPLVPRHRYRQTYLATYADGIFSGTVDLFHGHVFADFVPITFYKRCLRLYRPHCNGFSLRSLYESHGIPYSRFFRADRVFTFYEYLIRKDERNPFKFKNKIVRFLLYAFVVLAILLFYDDGVNRSYIYFQF